MNSQDVLKIYDHLLKNDVEVWIDGGWCVDALLGKQTREHPDLDIAVDHKNSAKIKKVLSDLGFKDDPRNDTTDWNYAMRDKNGQLIDIHVFEYDSKGNNVYGIEYPNGSLTGTGKIGGSKVKCLAAKYMFKFKTAYSPKQKDILDVQALAKKFGYLVPDTHRSV